MNGELAQIITLISYGNQFLSGQKQEAPELFPDNSTFRYVSEISFINSRTYFACFTTEKTVAKSSKGWFQYLQNMGFTQLRLGIVNLNQELADHISVAFAGGGKFVIQAKSETKTEVWRGHWGVNRSKTEKRNWAVQYYKFPSCPVNVEFGEFEAAKNELLNSLVNIKAFAEKANAEHWAKLFSESINELNNPSPVPAYHPDIVPSDIDLRVRQLISSACKAWVFGGMGSWNDIYFDDKSLQSEYENVSTQLYGAVIKSFGVALSSQEK